MRPEAEPEAKSEEFALDLVISDMEHMLVKIGESAGTITGLNRYADYIEEQLFGALGALSRTEDSERTVEQRKEELQKVKEEMVNQERIIARRNVMKSMGWREWMLNEGVTRDDLMGETGH